MLHHLHLSYYVINIVYFSISYIYICDIDIFYTIVVIVLFILLGVVRLEPPLRTLLDISENVAHSFLYMFSCLLSWSDYDAYRLQVDRTHSYFCIHLVQILV